MADDEPVVLDVVIKTLRRAGYKVLNADTGAAALDQANTHEGRISLLVLNHCLDARPGQVLVNKILAIHPRLKFCAFPVLWKGTFGQKVKSSPKVFSFKSPSGQIS